MAGPLQIARDGDADDPGADNGNALFRPLSHEWQSM
jgi:hypothetical protein